MVDINLATLPLYFGELMSIIVSIKIFILSDTVFL